MKNVLSLRPAQFVLGMREVEAKVKRIKSLNPKQLRKYINDHKVPVVKMKGSLYIVDHHHFVRACWEAGIKKIHVRIINNRKPCCTDSFWRFMSENKWAYLIDQFGRGPNDPRLLPLDIRCMADDPYRSLAWAARESGGFDKITVPFSEFRWANYLRKKVSLDLVQNKFPTAVKKAVKICKHKSASHLPGFKK